MVSNRKKPADFTFVQVLADNYQKSAPILTGSNILMIWSTVDEIPFLLKISSISFNTKDIAESFIV